MEKLFLIDGYQRFVIGLITFLGGSPTRVVKFERKYGVK
jgi:hypothetical protein